MIKREDEKVFVLNNDKENQYDLIIFACHANQVGAMLDEMSSEEEEILSMFEYTTNSALLHHDQNLMPNEKSLWSSWNSLKNNKYDYVSYWMNNLQKLDVERDIFVTLGNYPDVDEGKVFKWIKYEHPLYSEQTIKAQKLIRSIQGNRKTYFTGAHLGYGFHEDAVQSSLEIAHAFGIQLWFQTMPFTEARFCTNASSPKSTALNIPLAFFILKLKN